MLTVGLTVMIALSGQCSTGGIFEPCVTVAVDVEIPPSPEVVPEKAGYSLQLDEPAAVLRVVSSDELTPPPPLPSAVSNGWTKVRLAQQLAQQLATPPPNPVPPGIPRLTMSISPGLNIGRGQWSWRGTACNATDTEQATDQGDIEMAFNSAGIPVTGFGEAQTSNQLSINRSKPVVAIRIAQGVGVGGTALIASKLITATGVWGAGFAIGTVVTSLLVDYFKSVTPADLSMRFNGSKILKDGETVTLAPRGHPNHCSTWVLFARYSGKKAVAQANIPVY